ncbi:EAL domain-containing protein [Alkaliphilus serpentinus]|uniref:EAL domain-containing protein n=1 Tax=Alkaliphilus serpentinus TaxID=1482731 RepID=A0A833HQX2_9FIRM|nr:EAL domain-containing protein [Alkaliphilus serpentinus]KAB3532503.1 EAL domain-containing protein [Alkaliphilus serpentinus]
MLKKLNQDYRNEFFGILLNKSISTNFQPIISLVNGEIIGYEALTRGPEDSPLHYPDRLFEAAKRYNKVWELDLLCRITAIERAKDVIGDKFLFINIDADIIKDPEFKKGFTKEYLKAYNISPKSIIFEITEHTAITDYKSFKNVIENYRSQGYRVAVDDAGDGYAGLRMLSEIRPNFIKIDMELIRNIDKDMLKRELLKSIQRFVEATNLKIIAEGIETYDELRTLIDIGIEYGQGYYIQRPSPSFIKLNEDVMETIIKINNTKSLLRANSRNLRIGDYCRMDKALQDFETASKADELFKANTNLQGIVVMKDQKAVGLIMRNQFYQHLSADKEKEEGTFYSSNLHEFMDSNPLMVEAEELLSNVCRRALSRDENQVYDYVIINDRGYYKGVIPFGGLMDALLGIINY